MSLSAGAIAQSQADAAKQTVQLKSNYSSTGGLTAYTQSLNQATITQATVTEASNVGSPTIATDSDLTGDVASVGNTTTLVNSPNVKSIIVSNIPSATFNSSGIVKQTVYNVKDYGAVGNGVTDDTAAIQATITACDTAGGGIVFFPEASSSYLISSTVIVASNNVWLAGASWGAQLLAAGSFSATPMITVAAPGGSGVFRYGIKISDLMLNGNNVTGVGGIELDSTYGALLDHVRIYQCSGTGIYLTDPSQGGARGAYTTMRECWLTNGGAATAIKTFYAEDNTIDGGIISFYNSSGGIGIEFQDGGNTVVNMQFDECDTSVLNYFAHANQIVNNSFGRAVTTHINLEGAKNCLIVGNYFDECVGTPSPATIINANNSQNASNVISGNTCIGSGNNWTYFYYEAGGIGTPGNIVSNNQTAGLSMQAFTGILKTNGGYNPVGTLSISVPLTTVATAAQVVDSTFYITAGATSCAIVVSGVSSITIPATTMVAVFVPAGHTVTPTYTNAPTWVVAGN